MLVKEFAQAVLDEILFLEKDNEQIDYLIKLESQLFFQALKNFLKFYVENTEQFSVVYINRFVDLLSKRWFSIKHTDASYLHTQTTVGNLAAIAMAKHLQKQVMISSYGEVSDKEATRYMDPYFFFLMPTVGAVGYKSSRKNLGEFKLHEFILSDDGIPIEVQSCLDAAANNKTIRLYLTGGLKKQLTEAEKQRIIFHSQETELYYEAINFFVRSDIPNDMLAAKQMLADAMQREDYEVHSSYGIEGRKRLTKTVLSYINNVNDFSNLMRQIPLQNWKDFIGMIDDSDLKRLFLPYQSFSENVTNHQLYTNDVEHNRAIWFALSEVYIRQRRVEKRFTSKLGYFTAKSQKYLGSYTNYIRSYDREEKLQAADALQDLLASKVLLEDIENHFKTADLKQFAGPLFEMNSDLGLLTQQIRNFNRRKFASVRYA